MASSFYSTIAGARLKLVETVLTVNSVSVLRAAAGDGVNVGPCIVYCELVTVGASVIVGASAMERSSGFRDRHPRDTMVRPSTILILAVTQLLWCGPVFSGQQELPELLYNSDPHVHTPVWVSAAAAIDSDGAINDKLFPDSLREIIESYFAEPSKGDCYVVEETFYGWPHRSDRSTLDLAVKSSELILIGRITAAADGFHGVEAGRLLRIEPSEVLHGRASLDFYYVFFPVGNFTAGPYRICKSDSRYPRAPRVGDELLLMVPARTRLPDDPFLELEEASSVVVVPAEAKPDLPTVFKESAKARSTPSFGSKSDLVVAVKEALSKKETQR